MRVVVLTTSYPREPGDVAGRFIADAVDRLRGRGLDVEVVSPADFPHLGLAYGSPRTSPAWNARWATTTGAPSPRAS